MIKESGRGLRQPALVASLPEPLRVSAHSGDGQARGPVRVQLRRTKGWRIPDGTVVVARPTKWGNPFSVLPHLPIGQRVGGGREYYAVPTVEDAVSCYREMFTLDGETADGLRHALPELRGKNLACWCRLDQPCHADVLLELANQEPPGGEA